MINVDFEYSQEADVDHGVGIISDGRCQIIYVGCLFRAGNNHNFIYPYTMMKNSLGGSNVSLLLTDSYTCLNMNHDNRF